MENQMETGNFNNNRSESTSTWGQVRHTVARQLSNAAHALHNKTASTERPSELTKFGEQAAGWLERSADYVHDMEPQQIKADLESTVRRNPGRSLLIAGLAGVVLGNLLRRR
ncbi:MAG TPA: hypothetical protein VFZ34_25120 [Blastocatellia bacterium]|nr:hypothetical protein [Blastocatellia bacterium]